MLSMIIVLFTSKQIAHSTSPSGSSSLSPVEAALVSLLSSLLRDRANAALRARVLWASLANARRIDSHSFLWPRL